MEEGYRNIELNTVSKIVTSDTAGIVIGGQVPAGMKRWVTFLSLDTPLVTGASSVRLYLASVATNNPTKASLIATSNRKMLLDLRASGLRVATGLSKTSGHSRKNDVTPYGPPLMVPETPDTSRPLFSIAGGYYLGVYASYTTANVFVQYYDE